MKITFKSLISSHLLVLLTGVLILSSCTKDTNTPVTTYLLDFKKEYSLQTSFIINLLNEVATDNPEVIELINNTNYDVEVYSIKYKTTYHEEEIVASGLICVPVAPEGFPIISFQNGTNTSHANAPSVNRTNPLFALLESLSGNGYIILIPDYLGFGSSENILHPYYVKTSTNSAVVDMMYAAREFIDYYSSGANYNNQYFLMGYSQGGWATLAALEEIEANHASVFDIEATSCGAGAYDLINVADYIIHLDTFPSPLYLPYYIYSHQQYGSLDDPLVNFFQEPYASRIPELFDGSHNNSYINSQLTDTVPQLLVPEFVENFLVNSEYEALRLDLATNTVEAWTASSLIQFHHGTADLNVPISESQNIYADFIDLGLESSVQLIEMEGKNHETGILPWGINTFIWFNELKEDY